MIRESIIRRMRETRKSQRKVSDETGIEYTAVNTFLNNRKGMWFYRVQKILDYVGLSAEGTIPSASSQTIQTAAWMEMRVRKISVQDMATELGVSYNTLNGFTCGKSGMSIDKVEELMERLDIRLLPNDRYK